MAEFRPRRLNKRIDYCKLNKGIVLKVDEHSVSHVKDIMDENITESVAKTDIDDKFIKCEQSDSDSEAENDSDSIDNLQQELNNLKKAKIEEEKRLEKIRLKNEIKKAKAELSRLKEKQKVKAVNIAEVYRDDSIKRKFFIEDSVVDFQPGMTVEFRPIKTLKSVSASVTAKVVCGMLNSGKGGHIYFGIGKTGEVAGIEANRNDRDEFRIGLDIMMNNQLSPPVFHSLFDIDYFPVVRPTREQEVLEMVPIENLYIIDITVHSSNETVYTCKDKHSYFRFGPNTYPLSVQEVRQLITVDEESKYIEEICKLRRELNSLKFAA